MFGLNGESGILVEFDGGYRAYVSSAHIELILSRNQGK